MFCEHCGKKLVEGNKFCIHCGESATLVAPAPQQVQQVTVKSSEFPWFKYLIAILIIVLVSFAGYMLINSETETDATQSAGEGSQDSEYVPTILSELGYSMEPVGYFDDMSLFDSETLSTDEWISHVQFYDVKKSEQTDPNRQFKNRDKVFSSVVKIVCEADEYFIYGSGTNVDSSGYVLTNHHVVEGLPEDACMVGFPDPTTGLIKEAYWTTIITDKEDKTGHDLAYLAIEKPVFDEEGKIYGYYERISNSSFPYFEQTDECLSVENQLGDKILVLGYPPLSGEALTVTDGLISSLYSQNGYIITSAKIVSGNSGGLAIDENGCYIGVPTSIYYDEEETDSEVLGEIIDAEFVTEFDEAVEDDLEVYYKANGIEVPAYDSTLDHITVSGTEGYLIVSGALRDCPSKDCKVIRYYAEGAKVSITDSTSAWYKVVALDDYGNQLIGYMHESLFEDRSGTAETGEMVSNETCKLTATIKIFNTNSTQPQRLIKSTRFEDGGIKKYIFRLSDSILIPGSQNGLPGSVDATVYADGDDYERSKISGEFKVPGFLGTEQYDDIYANLVRLNEDCLQENI